VDCGLTAGDPVAAWREAAAIGYPFARMRVEPALILTERDPLLPSLPQHVGVAARACPYRRPLEQRAAKRSLTTHHSSAGAGQARWMSVAALGVTLGEPPRDRQDTSRADA